MVFSSTPNYDPKRATYLSNRNTDDILDEYKEGSHLRGDRLKRKRVATKAKIETQTPKR